MAVTRLTIYDDNKNNKATLLIRWALSAAGLNRGSSWGGEYKMEPSPLPVSHHNQTIADWQYSLGLSFGASMELYGIASKVYWESDNFHNIPAAQFTAYFLIYNIENSNEIEDSRNIYAQPSPANSRQILSHSSSRPMVARFGHTDDFMFRVVVLDVYGVPVRLLV